MGKLTETQFYKNWYAKIERSEYDKVDIPRIRKEWEKIVNEQTDSPLTMEHKAILFAQCVFRTQLKSPSQAVFPALEEFEVKNENDLWIVSGYCDAPNSYGALTRGKFNICLRYDGIQFDYVIPEDKVKNTMIGSVVIVGFVCLIILGILAPILAM